MPSVKNSQKRWCMGVNLCCCVLTKSLSRGNCCPLRNRNNAANSYVDHSLFGPRVRSPNVDVPASPQKSTKLDHNAINMRPLAVAGPLTPFHTKDHALKQCAPANPQECSALVRQSIHEKSVSCALDDSHTQGYSATASACNTMPMSLTVS